MSKHISAPWEVYAHWIIRPVGMEDHSICTTALPYRTPEENEALAHSIVIDHNAHDDLVAALTVLLTEVEGLILPLDTNPKDKFKDIPSIKQALAALEKAKK